VCRVGPIGGGFVDAAGLVPPVSGLLGAQARGHHLPAQRPRHTVHSEAVVGVELASAVGAGADVQVSADALGNG